MIELIIGILVALGAVITILNFARKRRVYHGETGLLYRDGRFVQELTPGAHRVFDPLRKHELVRISTLPTAMTAHQYDVISSDQFAFRVNVALLYTIVDARHFHENTPQVAQELYGYLPGPEARLTRLVPVMAESVREAVSSKTLEEFLADPTGILNSANEVLADNMPGMQLDKLAVTAVNLPPEVRKMFTEVERARREGLASLERAKAEQASLRALANAARNMAGNPQLAQLKMLQVMESAKGAKTFVLGNPSDAAEIHQGAKD